MNFRPEARSTAFPAPVPLERISMNRREFSLQLAGTAGAVALSSLGLPGLALASPSAPVDGTDYLTLQTPLMLPKTGKVEVSETGGTATDDEDFAMGVGVKVAVGVWIATGIR